MNDYPFADIPVPAGFRYRDVLKGGRPMHDKFDSFSIKHPAMDLGKRAKIFSPFDALKGFNEAVAAKDVIYVERHELSEDEQAVLSDCLSELSALTINSKEARKNCVTVSVTFFEPCRDPFNDAYMVKGTYTTVTGMVTRIDTVVDRVIKVNGQNISLDDVLKIVRE